MRVVRAKEEGGVDVDTLIDRIREAGRQRTVSTSGDRTDQSIEELKRTLRPIIAQGEAIDQIPVKLGGWRGSLEFRIKRFLKWLVHWNTRPQAEFNRGLFDTTTAILQELDRLHQASAAAFERVRKIEDVVAELHVQTENGARLAQELGGTMGLLSTKVDDLGRRIDAIDLSIYWSDLERKFVNELDRLRNEATARLSALEEKVGTQLDEMRIRALRAERAERGKPRSSPSAWDQSSPSAAEGAGAGAEESFDYFLFEQKFRGSTQEVKRRQSCYIESYRGNQNVLDIGCGRGEFLELLAENGVRATGVDINQDMVEFCRDKGLNVVHADLFRYLEEQVRPGSLDGVFAAQLVEHLYPDQIIKLLSLCGRKIRPGGVIAIETVNTTSLAAMSNFYLDPSHVRPVPAEMLRFMLEQGPFSVRSIRFSSPASKAVPEVIDLPSGTAPESSDYLDYAIIAVRGE